MSANKKGSMLSRRKFVRLASVGVAGLATSGFKKVLPSGSTNALPASFLRTNKFAHKVIVLGMDGVDPKLVRRFVEEGHLPTFKKMIEKGYFGELQTTNPPQSPVAWASFITGTNPGGHGIFDFVHREPSSFTPYLSTSRSYESSRTLDFGSLRIPLQSGHVELMRRGTALWDVLEMAGVPCTVCQIPANFPVAASATKAVSGMGTPDLLGTYGTYTFFTEDKRAGPASFAGGRIVQIALEEHAASLILDGPKNAFNTQEAPVSVAIKVQRDAEAPLLKIDLQGNELLLKEGEWSGWCPIRFEYLKFFASASGMVRFYLKKVHPTLELYVSPINVDPLEPSLPISSPPSYARELAEAIGRFHTQGFPADTKALSTGVFSDDEFLSAANIVLEESMRLLEYQFDRFDAGFFFFYFSTTDQGGHMLWRSMHPDHPLYDPNASSAVKGALLTFYKRMDDALKLVLSKSDDTTVIALSDHGFVPFTREFNLSTWLLENGYTTLTDLSKQSRCDFYSEVAWDKTQAYALGINGLYLNRIGREKAGIVADKDVARLKAEIADKLLKVKDSVTGESVFSAIFDATKLYSGKMVPFAPDLIMGYNRNYRISDEAVLGRFPSEILRDRTDLWSADHCMEASHVPGMLLSNRQIKPGSPAIWDLAPSILYLFGVQPPPDMTGAVVFT